MKSVILAIESSCDENSAAVLVDGKVRSNTIYSQDIHNEYGGVVPELASRAHQRQIMPVVEEALSQAGVRAAEIDAIACTQGPGLLGSLLVGVNFAKGLSIALKKPIIGVHHMKAHILAHFIDDPCPEFPFLCLTVSGGHTQIVLVKNHLDMEILGETQDDAVGEAFDKASKILGLGYPGGPIIDKLAKTGDPKAFSFPDTDVAGLNYSFSGIKTAFLYFLRDQKTKNPDFVKSNLHDICASYQSKLLDMLFEKLEKAQIQTGINEIAIAGGVAANSGLRSRLDGKAADGWRTYIPKFEYCTDNAAMIGIAGFYEYLNGNFSNVQMTAEPRRSF